MERRPTRRPVWLPSRSSRFKTVLNQLLHKVTWSRLGLAIFALPVILYAYREVTHDALIIDPFSVPKRFEEAGFTPDVMAARVGDKLREMESVALTQAKKDNLSSGKGEQTTLDVEIPGTKFGVKAVLDLTRDIFGVYPKHVSGDVVDLPSSTTAAPREGSPESEVTVYVTQGRERSDAVTARVAYNNFDQLVQRTAEAILGEVNPIVLAVYLRDQREYDRALEIVQGIAADPTVNRSSKAFAVNVWGTLLAHKGSDEAAIVKYQEALRLDPKLPIAYGNWGVALGDEKRYDEAFKLFRKALTLDPRLALTYANWGTLLANQGRYDDAIVKLRKAAAIDPRLVFTYVTWGDTLAAQKKYDEAVAQYQTAAQVNPRSALPYISWGTILARQGKLEQAAAKLERAIELDPRSAVAYGSLGAILAEQKKYDDAMADFRTAAALDHATAPEYNAWIAMLTKVGSYGSSR